MPSHSLVNLAAGLVYAITLPIAAIATSYLYIDLLVREKLEEPAREARSEVLPAEI